jgi:hypothetical protein
VLAKLQACQRSHTPQSDITGKTIETRGRCNIQVPTNLVHPIQIESGRIIVVGGFIAVDGRRKVPENFLKCLNRCHLEAGVSNDAIKNFIQQDIYIPYESSSDGE